MDGDSRPELHAWRERIERTLDEQRSDASARRHARGYRTARENVADLVDAGSFQEYGQLAVAAQRSRRDYEDLQTSTAADGIITGTCTINAERVGAARGRAAIIVNDYSVLAGTQGFFHHKKLDRMCELAQQLSLPLVMCVPQYSPAPAILIFMSAPQLGHILCAATSPRRSALRIKVQYSV